MLRYECCDDHPGVRGSMDCNECVDEMRDGQAVLREIAGINDAADDRDETRDPVLNAVLAELGWRTARSVIPGRKRVYDETDLWLNVWSEEEIWSELERRGLARRRSA